MEKITDLQLCGCIMLKYAFAIGKANAIISLLGILVTQMGMNHAAISETLSGIELTENNTSFMFSKDLDIHLKKLLAERGIYIN